MHCINSSFYLLTFHRHPHTLENPAYSFSLLILIQGARKFYRPDVLPVIQTTVSKHWRMTVFLTGNSILPPCCQDRSGTLQWLCGMRCPLALRKHPSHDNNSVSDLLAWWASNAVVSVLFTGRMPILSPNQPCQRTEGSSYLLTYSTLNISWCCTK